MTTPSDYQPPAAKIEDPGGPIDPARADQLRTHQKVVGWIHALSSLLGLPVLLLIASGAVEAVRESADPSAVLIGFVIGITVVLCAISTAMMIAGFFFTRGLRWPRYVLWPVSIFSLLSVPIGTALGAYTIWVLVQTRELPAPSGDVAPA